MNEEQRLSEGDTSTVSAVRRKKAKRNLIIIFVAIVVVGAAYWYFRKSFSVPFEQVGSFESSLTEQLANNFSAPPPIQFVPSKYSSAKKNALISADVIAQTNVQREQNGGLPPLSENTTLDDIATLRLDDMFQQQYFAHGGPQGESALTVASSVGYAYLALGENLALGDFATSGAVVAAWMASPGHRANILDVHYTEIGVAVREGTFQGATTWLAVQVFGRPSSDCPAVDSKLESSITSEEQSLSAMDAELQSEKADINAMQPQSGDAYNQKVGQYNTLAEQYNMLADEEKSQITQYDAEVQAFNACLNML